MAKKIVTDSAVAKKMVEFDYTDRKKIDTHRQVEPYDLTDKGDGFFGYDPLKQAIRHFKFKGISNIEGLEDSFDPRWELKTQINAEA